MKGSEAFKQKIKAHLESIAVDDILFAKKYTNEKKTLDECITYILAEVYKSGKNGFTDAEIFGIAVHYFDEDDIKIDYNSKINNVHIISNYDATEEEKIKAKEIALQRLQNEAYEKLKAKRNTKKPTEEDKSQTLLF